MTYDTGLAWRIAQGFLGMAGVGVAIGSSLALLSKLGQQHLPPSWLREERRRPEAFHGVTIRFPIDKRQ